MRPSLVTAVLLVATSSACKAEPPREHGPIPMRVPVGSQPATVGPASHADETSRATETGDSPSTPVVLLERPRADPEIERALDLINGSGLRFIDRPTDDADTGTDAESDDEPSEYTAEQFATMLRTKWDWVGYDITELELWLDEIATGSFRTSVPYQVVYADGTVGELRVWLDQQLQATGPNEGQP